MKINNTVNFNYSNGITSNNNAQNKQQQTLEHYPKNEFASTPPLYTNQYLAQYLPQNPAFTGGYSIDLAETAKNLTGEACPPDIKKMMEDTLAAGNPENKTLIDIHKEKYGKINQMKSLDEVKAAYPEFKNVLSDEEITYSNNSFIADVKNGKLEWFDEDTDLALQLLQMYWADGFSLNDLKEYTNGKNINGVLDKFNIPKLNTRYANVLKLSDKKYNERFTSKMSEKLTGIQRKRAEKRDGVYIPRGPMSDETKKKISEGLIKHYAEHPEKIIEMSERMKQYYAEHPEECENLSNVLDIAWSLREAKSVRKALSKFLKKKDISPEEFSKLNLSDNKDEKKTLKEFWDRNTWARKQWSVCMTKGWEIYNKQKEEEEDKKNIIPINVYPPSLVQDMKDWFRKNGYDINKITDLKAYTGMSDKVLSKKDAYADDAATAYFKTVDKDMKAHMYHICLIKTLSDVICSNKLDDMTRYTLGLLLAENLKINDTNKTYEEMSEEELVNGYSKVYASCIEEGNRDALEIIDDNLERAYWCVKNQNAALAKKIGVKAIKAFNILMAEEKLNSLAFVPQEMKESSDYNIVPHGLKKEIINSIKQAGIGIISDKEMEKRISDKDVQTIVNSYLQNESVQINVGNACQLSMMKTVHELLNEAADKGCPKDKRDAIFAIRNFFYFNNFDEENSGIKDATLKELSLQYTNMINFAKIIDYPDIIQRFEYNLNEIYSVIKESGTDAAIDMIFKEAKEGN